MMKNVYKQNKIVKLYFSFLKQNQLYFYINKERNVLYYYNLCKQIVKHLKVK